MLYVLLIIIAVGVLLISPIGKVLLGWSIVLAIIAVILLLGVASLVFVEDEYGDNTAIILSMIELGIAFKVFSEVYKEFNGKNRYDDSVENRDNENLNY